MSDFNPYFVLGIDSTATSAEIKSAHRRLAMIHHPDRGTAPNDSEFIKIQKAYDILRDEVLRAFYDATGNCEIDRSMIEKASQLILANNIQETANFLVAEQIPIEEFDVSKAVRVLTSNQVSAIQNKILDLQKMVKTLRRMSSRQKKKSEGANILRLVYAKKIGEVSKELNQANMSLMASKMALEIALDFADQDDNVAMIEKSE